MQDQQFFPASSNALPDEVLPPEVQALTSNPLYNPVAASEVSASSMSQPHDLAASTSQASPRVSLSVQGAQANRRWPWRWGL